MLTELCKELRNWFEKEKHFGKFTIEGGQLTDGSFLQDGQYYRIIGSVFNDGVHKWPDDDLVNESFEGAIWAMAVPPAVVALSDDIESWVSKYDDIEGTNMSPFSSESFGGYSYSKGGGSAIVNSSNRGNGAPTWKSMFATELNKWRKI